MKVALAQINTTVGDLAGNEAKILAAYQRALSENVEIIIFPELTIVGYPPRDLLLKKNFISENLAALHRIAAVTGKTAALIGFVDENKSRPGRPLTNNAALLQNGKIMATRLKTLLPTYDVFDEDRYFQPALKNIPIDFNGQKIGLTICEDIWNDEDFWPERRYQHNPPLELISDGAKILFNVSASPWCLGKEKVRREMLSSLARKTKTPVVFCNLVGGNDELIFDGGSMVFNATGGLIAQAELFTEDFVIVDTNSPPALAANSTSDEETLYR
ncbi:MAG: nitrilase-related carbon-nitrogen hydrolase, partial [Limisphaerales bacterium]